MNVTCVTVDCHDPQRVAEFWNEALHWDGVRDADGGQVAICASPDGGPYLEFVRVPERKQLKNRVHLGCRAESLADLDAEVERLLGLGATLAWEEEFPEDVASQYRNLVLLDVEGNEFCLGAGRYPDG